MQDERHGKPKVSVYRQTDKNVAEFWAEFKDADPTFSTWKDGVPTVKPADGKDHDWEKQEGKERLFKSQDNAGTVTYTEIVPAKKNAFLRSMLSSEHVFIFDAGPQIYVWVGSKADEAEKASSMKYAGEYMKQNQKHPCLPITRLIEGGDNESFTTYFR